MEDRTSRASRGRAFTLIELLIVVAIIAILAAIAVPNFLEAQVRAKVSRARNDLRTVATALEAYHVDHNTYPPNDGNYNVLPVQLTTPVAFLSTSLLEDPFRNTDVDTRRGILVRYYTYCFIVDRDGLIAHTLAGIPPPIECVDMSGLNLGAFEKYGPWRLVSYGPDSTYSCAQDRSYGSCQLLFTCDPIVQGSDVLYDPTNGTVSWGNLLRTQKFPQGLEPRLPCP